MNLSRRKTLALTGGGFILAALGGAGYRIARSADAATEPWRKAGRYADIRTRALSWAILAPNPHNRQPWKADLSVPNQIALYVDLDRMLPHTDPFNRQIAIGLGCFLEVLRIAAAQDGADVRFDLFPKGSDPKALDSRPVAIAHFGGANRARSVVPANSRAPLAQRTLRFESDSRSDRSRLSRGGGATLRCALNE